VTYCDLPWAAHVCPSWSRTISCAMRMQSSVIMLPGRNTRVILGGWERDPLSAA